MSAATRPAPRFRVGEWVSFLYGPRRTQAQIIEDRGPIGVQGRRIYRVRLDLEQADSMAFELPEEDLERAKAPDIPNPLLKATLEYIRQGKQFKRISSETFPMTERRVTFHFADGTEEVRSFECDHETFMQWWKETSAYLRDLAEAFGRPGDAKA
jgi:hypothetical protein